jgi:hypothetical protein
VNRVRDFFKLGSKSKDDRLDFRMVVPCKPDVDNLAKFHLDGRTGIVFDDDPQVVELGLTKLRDDKSACEDCVAIQCQIVGMIKLPMWMDADQPMIDWC